MSTKSKLQKKADKLFQDFIKAKYKTCFICGKRPIVGHHFITKANSSALRYDLENIIPLCVKCHCLIHSQPALITAKIVLKKGKDWVEYLNKHKRNPKLRLTIKYYKDIILWINTHLSL